MRRRKNSYSYHYVVIVSAGTRRQVQTIAGQFLDGRRVSPGVLVKGKGDYDRELARLRTFFPVGTVFGTTTLSHNARGFAGFYCVEDLHPLNAEPENLLQMPLEGMAEAYEQLLSENNHVYHA